MNISSEGKRRKKEVTQEVKGEPKRKRKKIRKITRGNGISLF
jgi:hypothetical protein